MKFCKIPLNILKRKGKNDAHYSKGTHTKADPFLVFVLIVIITIMVSCSDPTTPPTVTGVEVSPSATTVLKGSTIQFTATVKGNNKPSQDVIWSIMGDKSSNTSINEKSGLLFIATDETTDILTITATSSINKTKTGVAIVTIPQVTSVDVNPANISVNKGQTQQFTSVVNGSDGISPLVTWTVIDNESIITHINTDGLLTIDVEETATTLTVRATSSFDTNQSGISIVTVTDLMQTVTDVVISPATATILKGQSQQFEVVVNGNNNPPQAVTWDVTGGLVNNTSINSNGLLFVADDESAETLTVTATSTFDDTKSSTATVTVTDTETIPSVTGVVVSPAETTIVKGQTQQFDAVVEGNNFPPQTVTWAVNGGSSSDTFISLSGLLTVAENETVDSVTVIATSTFDETISGTANVTLTDIVTTVTDVIVSPATSFVSKGNVQQFIAEVQGSNNPPQYVTWAVNVDPLVSNTYILPSGLLMVADRETQMTLIVTATSVADTTISGTATVTVTIPTVTDVTISPDPAYVHIGQTFQFSVLVNGSNNPHQRCSWAFVGSHHSATYISPCGFLAVSANETATYLTVKATSIVDHSISGTATVILLGADLPTVTRVIVSPTYATLGFGQSLLFEATVNGSNNPSQTVTWSLIGGNLDTALDENGLLYVSEYETAQILRVRATSTINPTMYGEAIVTVIDHTTTNYIVVSPPTATVRLGQSLQFSAVVNGAGNPPQAVLWSLIGNVSNTSINANGLLSVGSNETASSLRVIATSAIDYSVSGSTYVIITAVGTIGPGGGYIFYDNGKNANEDGWRYLEAAPADSEFIAPWGLFNIPIYYTSTAIGSGRTNTANIVSHLNSNGETGKAAQLCDALTINGYSDWFLPSKNELNEMYLHLRLNGNIGCFDISGDHFLGAYWSSSAHYQNPISAPETLRHTWLQYFINGEQGSYYYFGIYRYLSIRVRAIRAF